MKGLNSYKRPPHLFQQPNKRNTLAWNPASRSGTALILFWPRSNASAGWQHTVSVLGRRVLYT